MALKKVFNLRRLSGINSRGAIEDAGSDKSSRGVSGVASSKQNADEDLPTEVNPEKSVPELAIAIVADEEESIDSRFQVYTLPSETIEDECTKDEQSEVRQAFFIRNESGATDNLIQVYEVVDLKSDDGSSNESLMGVLPDETTAFEILSLSSSKDYGSSIFSGVVGSDAGSINKVKLTCSDEDTAACGSLVTKIDECIAESDRSTTAVGPEILLSKDQNLSRRHTLKRFFSVMSLIEGKRSADETDGAIDSKATLETNSLEESSFKSSCASMDETSNQSKNSSVAIAMFSEGKTYKLSKTKSKVLAPSNAAGNREAKKKVVSIMIKNFKQLAGKSVCFCDNDAKDQIVYEKSDVSIEGIFSRDVEDSESRISCALDHADTFTLDSMGLNGNRMYM